MKRRGQDTEGYDTTSYGKINVVRIGDDSFNEQNLRTLLNYKNGSDVIVHTRYRTSGDTDNKSLLESSHPHTINGHVFSFDDHLRTIDAQHSMVHNGTVFLDASEYIEGFEPKTNCDTEHLLTLDYNFGSEYVLKKVPGTYSIITMDKDGIATSYRDRYRRRPLWLGIDKNNNCYLLQKIVP